MIAPVDRHYGLDWLRIGAFGLLILFHIGLYLSPWDWHISARKPVDGIVYFLFLTNPWRMSLLFLVSGYATRAVLVRSRNPQQFATFRSRRLLAPLLFGAGLLVAPQAWVEAQDKVGYEGSFWRFWGTRYFDFDGGDGIDTPMFAHLWFVAYIWVYSMLVAIGARVLPARATERAQAWFAHVFARPLPLLLVPMAWQGFVRLILLPGKMPSNHWYSDLAGHLVYLPVFLFGLALARAPALWPAIGRLWRPALALAVLGYAGTVWDYLEYPGVAVPAEAGRVFRRLFLVIGTWPTILALLCAADRFLNRDHRWRATLNEAVFPFYIIHQTVTVLIGWHLYHHQYGDAAEAAILVAGTVAGCLLFYLIGRRMGPLAVLFGLAPRWPGQAEGAKA